MLRRGLAGGKRTAAVVVVALVCLSELVLTAGALPGRTTGPYTWGTFESASPIVDTPSQDSFQGTVAQIATSNAATYVLTTTGQVWAIGDNLHGALGDNGTVNSFNKFVKVDFPSGVTIASLADPMPFDTGVAIDTTGGVWGWGLNGGGELCMTETSMTTPEPLSLANVSLVSGAGQHTLYDVNGTLQACGVNLHGELGNGTFTSSSTPVDVSGMPQLGVSALTSSWEGSGALMTDGSYWDWGYNHAGQLGNGTTIDSDVPVKVPLTAPAVAVSQGGSNQYNGQSIALLGNGSVWTWGNGRYGQLGNGHLVNSAAPVQAEVPTGVTTVGCGGSSCYAIDSSGTLWSWGQNQAGQLGNGTFNGAPVDVPKATGLSGVSQVTSTATNVAAS